MGAAATADILVIDETFNPLFEIPKALDDDEIRDIIDVFQSSF